MDKVLLCRYIFLLSRPWCIYSDTLAPYAGNTCFYTLPIQDVGLILTLLEMHLICSRDTAMTITFPWISWRSNEKGKFGGLKPSWKTEEVGYVGVPLRRNPPTNMS